MTNNEHLYNVSHPSAVNGLNQYTSAGPAGFTYDANGNLTTMLEEALAVDPTAQEYDAP